MYEFVRPLDADGEHAPQRHDALAQVDVRRGEAQLAAAFGAMGHAPADAEITPQERLRLFELAVAQAFADAAAADPRAIQETRFRGNDIKTQFLAVGAQHLRIAPPPLAEAEVIADDEPFDAQIAR